MKVSHLRMLLAVEQAGSISRAATRLGIAQASLSRTVREIEKAHGINLFERTGRGVRTSKAGEEYLRQAQSVVKEEVVPENEYLAFTIAKHDGKGGYKPT